jgi:acyl-CoA synthetase (AMP-forming)/AMP-acid ligase II
MNSVATDDRLIALVEGGTGDHVALRGADDEQTITYAELAGRVEILAGRLSSAGVRRGDRVALALPNSPEFVEVLLAITAVGAAAAPLNPAYTVDEFRFYLDDIGPRLLLLPPGRMAAARTAAEGIAEVVPAGPSVVDLAPRPGDAPSLVLDGREIVDRHAFDAGDPDDVALVLHTSGTTSRPKQVPLLQRNGMASVRTIVTHYALGPSDVSFCAMPLFHVHGLVASAFSSLGGGGTAVVPGRFTPAAFWAQARANRITWLSAGPTLHHMTLDRYDDGGPPASLRFVRSCSSALSPQLMERCEDRYGAPMLEAYGMTEASHQMASNPLPPARRMAGSVGIPTGTEIAIIDRHLVLLPEGSQGEVVVRGPTITPGYLNNPAANAEAFFDGWFRTGDIGVVESGYLRLEGRLKEMILRGGENISPSEIEQALSAHPAVVDAVCFGVPDEKYGETVAAAVTLSAEVDERTLIEHCRQRLAGYKVPEVIHVMSEIPRTATGKLQRRRVAELVASERSGR